MATRESKKYGSFSCFTGIQTLICLFEGEQVRLEGEVFIADSAVVIGRVLLRHQSSVWWGAVLRGDYQSIVLGERSNIQDNCTIHNDPGSPLELGRQVTVGHNAVVHGCTIGNNCLIGIGSIIMNDVEIGNDCLVGSNTLITEGMKIPNRSLVLGSPGRVIRELDDKEVVEITGSSDRYVELSQRYMRSLELNTTGRLYCEEH